ncbi:MAG: rhodanese-like domain-containing protein [Candidatus Latescibacteria bacterium]|nr:rhodanese-like domain-containing protein [Candidatus Latescibacterota bacterium]
MSFDEYSPAQALELLQGDTGYVYVDVRSTPEYEQGHPAGAFNVPLFHRQSTGMTPNPDFLRVMEKVFPPETKLLLGCQSGNRSARAAEALAAAGYTCVANVRGGFGGVRDQFGRVVEKGWLELGLPVEQGSPADKGYAALALKE